MFQTRQIRPGLFRLILLAAIAIPSISGGVTAHGYKRKTLEIIHPWTSERAEANGRDAIVGLSIRNSGKQAERLQYAISPIADSVELRPDPANGAIRPGAALTIEIKPGQEVHLRPSGAHVRLIGLKKSLTPYDTLPVTLVFERAGRIAVDVLVEEATPTEK